MSQEIDSLDITDELIAESKTIDLDNLPEDMSPLMRYIVIISDTINLYVGRVTCLILLVTMVAMVYEVVARKLFIAPTYWAYDISRMTVGAMFMLGAGYALMRGVHIRADFLYRLVQPRYQALLDLILYIVFFFPGMIFFFVVSYEYTYDAWMVWELSMDTAWMAPLAPARTAMPIGALLLIIQGMSECAKCMYAFKHNRWV